MQAHCRLREWLVADTLPVWCEDGYDRINGGFHERLSFDRKPVVAEGKRILVQARQCFAFAAFGAEVPNGTERARDGYRFLIAKGAHPDGGWRHRVAGDGAPSDDSRDLYDQAFVMFASAAAFGTLGLDAALGHARGTLEYLDRERAHPAGGYTENVPADGSAWTGPRRQNPHMHLFEALLALYEVSGEGMFLARAAQLFELARRRFVVDGTLREYFTDALTPVPGDIGQIVEPGHHLEWAWLLHRYASHADDPAAIQLAATLYAFALDHGYDAVSGGLHDEVLSDGTVRRDDRRLWPQTEALKAHAAWYEETGDIAARARIEAGIGYLMAAHLRGPKGTWQEHLHADGVNFYGSCPASSLYHLGFAVTELDRVLSIGP